MAGNNAKKHRARGEGSVYRDARRGCWIAQLTVGFNGITGGPIRRVRSASTQRGALRRLAELKEIYRNQARVEADEITVEDWLRRWFDFYSRPHLRDTTAERYEDIIKKTIAFLGNIKMGKITELDLQNVINEVYKDSYDEARKFRVIMKMAFQRAKTIKLLPENIAENLELPRRPQKKPFVRPTKKQREALLKAKTVFYCWRQILLTEYMTGLRRGEILALHWSDINLEEGWLQVRYALTVGRKKKGMDRAPIILTEPKTDQSKRQIFLPAALCRELASYRCQQLRRQMQADWWEHPDLVFTYKDGEYISPAMFSSQFAKARKALGIQTTFHMLRHDMASRMKASRHFDLKDIQEQLGHSSIKVTMDIYTHLTEDGRKSVGGWLDEEMGSIVDMDEAKKDREAK